MHLRKKIHFIWNLQKYGKWLKNGKPKIFLNYKGQGKVTLALEKWHAIGLAGQLKTLADETLRVKFEHERKASANYSA